MGVQWPRAQNVLNWIFHSAFLIFFNQLFQSVTSKRVEENLQKIGCENPIKKLNDMTLEALNEYNCCSAKQLI